MLIESALALAEGEEQWDMKMKTHTGSLDAMLCGGPCALWRELTIGGNDGGSSGSVEGIGSF